MSFIVTLSVPICNLLSLKIFHILWITLYSAKL